MRLVWSAAPGWTVASVVVMVLQSLVTLATLYLFKLIVDYLTRAGGETAAQRSVENGRLPPLQGS